MREIRADGGRGLREFIDTVRDDMGGFLAAASYCSQQFRYGHQLGLYILSAPLRALFAAPRRPVSRGKDRTSRAKSLGA